MVYLMVNWVVSTVGLLLFSAVSPGFRITEVEAALLGAGVTGLINAAMAAMLRQVPGQFALVVSSALLLGIDTVVYRLMALLLPGFAMLSFYPAFGGAILLVLINILALWHERRVRTASDVGTQTLMRL